jgi:hypothetical protein
MKVVKKFNPIQRSFISKHDLDNLLKLPDHLMVPMNLLQWLAGHTSHGEAKKKSAQVEDHTLHQGYC